MNVFHGLKSSITLDNTNDYLLINDFKVSRNEIKGYSFSPPSTLIKGSIQILRKNLTGTLVETIIFERSHQDLAKKIYTEIESWKPIQKLAQVS